MPQKQVLAVLALLLGLPLFAQQAAISADPAADKANPATMQSFQLPSHGALLNALVYVASGAGPHPVVVLLHGFPGNERNLDIAQTLRRAGYDVLFFDYRGSWGSPGVFSLGNCIEDTQAAIAYLRDSTNAAKLRSDPSNIILFGHSMGGFLARYVAAHDPAIRATVLVSAADMGNDRVETIPVTYRDKAIGPLAEHFAAEGMAPLAGVTPESLAKEVVAHADSWNVPATGQALTARPLLVVTSDDGLAPSNAAVSAAIRKAGGGTKLTEVHFATDHSYSDQRIALETTILNFLVALPKP
jgi:pimeloyl-ACP methyl ester carboxylesterase